MPSTEVVIPYRAGCSHRDRALRWVLGRYADTHPGWRVTLAEAPDGPWIKALAVVPAIRASTADIIVVADADCWTDGLSEAVREAADGGPWAIPHRCVHRLSEPGTVAVLDGQPWEQQPVAQRPYHGIPGGGFVVLPRLVALAIPLDPRYVGWGQEDESLAAALHTLTGDPWCGDAPLIHLWHPPQPRLTRRRGSAESWELRRRYERARGNQDAMATLIGEAHERFAVDEPALHATSAVSGRH